MYVMMKMYKVMCRLKNTLSFKSRKLERLSKRNVELVNSVTQLKVENN